MEEGFLIVSLLHEMARHLQCERYFLPTVHERLATPRQFLGDLPDLRADHGEAFRHALLDVIQAWYGNPRHHDWAHEQTSVYALAVNQWYAH